MNLLRSIFHDIVKFIPSLEFIDVRDSMRIGKGIPQRTSSKFPCRVRHL